MALFFYPFGEKGSESDWRNLTKTSRFISLILRHKPETIGIALDEHGWANVSELIDGISKTQYIDMAILEKNM